MPFQSMVQQLVQRLLPQLAGPDGIVSLEGLTIPNDDSSDSLLWLDLIARDQHPPSNLALDHCEPATVKQLVKACSGGAIPAVIC